MYNPQIHNLARIFLILLILGMQWLTKEEGSWYKGLVIYLIFAYYFAPKTVEKYQEQFNTSVTNKNKKRAVLVSLKMWGLANLYLLIFVIAYYSLILLYVILTNWPPNVGNFLVVGVYILSKVIGMLLTNVVIVPLICITTFFVYKKCLKIESGLDPAYRKRQQKHYDRMRVVMQDLKSRAKEINKDNT